MSWDQGPGLRWSGVLGQGSHKVELVQLEHLKITILFIMNR
jgi:hypothetical protein